VGQSIDSIYNNGSTYRNLNAEFYQILIKTYICVVKNIVCTNINNSESHQ